MGQQIQYHSAGKCSGWYCSPACVNLQGTVFPWVESLVLPRDQCPTRRIAVDGPSNTTEYVCLYDMGVSKNRRPFRVETPGTLSHVGRLIGLVPICCPTPPFPSARHAIYVSCKHHPTKENLIPTCRKRRRPTCTFQHPSETQEGEQKKPGPPPRRGPHHEPSHASTPRPPGIGGNRSRNPQALCFARARGAGSAAGPSPRSGSAGCGPPGCPESIYR